MLVNLSDISSRPIDFLRFDSTLELFLSSCGIQSNEELINKYFDTNLHWATRALSTMQKDIDSYLTLHNSSITNSMNTITAMTKALAVEKPDISYMSGIMKSTEDTIKSFTEGIGKQTYLNMDYLSEANKITTASFLVDYNQKISDLIKQPYFDAEIINPPVVKIKKIEPIIYEEKKGTDISIVVEKMDNHTELLLSIHQHITQKDQSSKNEFVEKIFVITTCKDHKLNELIREAKARYLENDAQVALEKLWGAFERIKNYLSPDKKDGANKLIELISKNFAHINFMEEFKTLTVIGNKYSIRHKEPDQMDLLPAYQHFLFTRMFSFLGICLSVLETEEFQAA